MLFCITTNSCTVWRTFLFPFTRCRSASSTPLGETFSKVHIISLWRVQQENKNMHENVSTVNVHSEWITYMCTLQSHDKSQHVSSGFWIKSTVSLQSVYIYSKAYELSSICNQSVSKSAWRIRLHISCCQGVINLNAAPQSRRPWQSFVQATISIGTLSWELHQEGMYLWWCVGSSQGRNTPIILRR